METGLRGAEKEREQLIQKYIRNSRYTGFESKADGINHLAFIADDLDKTIEFYTQVVGLKLLRVRPLDGDSRQGKGPLPDRGNGHRLGTQGSTDSSRVNIATASR
jgi:hypothetical protein